MFLGGLLASRARFTGTLNLPRLFPGLDRNRTFLLCRNADISTLPWQCRGRDWHRRV